MLLRPSNTRYSFLDQVQVDKFYVGITRGTSEWF